MKPKTRVWALLCGLCVGWLVGLAVSPVVSIVVSGLTVTLAAIAGTLAGIDPKPQINATGRRAFVDFAPLGMIFLGVLVGSIGGIEARTHSWLSPNIKTVINEWTAPEIGLDRKEVAMRLFNERYPPLAPAESKPSEGALNLVAPNQTVLYGTSTNECINFRSKEDNPVELRAEMQSSVTSYAAREFASKIKDADALREAVNIFLCPTK